MLTLSGVLLLCLTLCDCMDCSPPALLLMGFPRQKSVPHLCFLLQGIFPENEKLFKTPT